MTTRIADVIVPEVFNPYVVNRTMELSSVYQSGIVSHNEELDRLASSGGRTINMPYWDDLTGADEVLSDSAPLTPAKITAGQDVAVLFMRGKAWAANDLAKALSGDDPMRAIGDLVAGYWARRLQALLFSVLKGAFSAANMTENKHSVALTDAGTPGPENGFTGKTFTDAVYKLGDAAEQLTAVAVHSATMANLVKQQLIEYERDAEGRILWPTFMGKRVIVDDGCPVEFNATSGHNEYTSYIFGAGAIGFGNGNPPVPTETDRDSLQGDDILINRKHFILHPRGIAWQDANVAGSSPTNAECEDGANWSRVYEPKQIRIVQFIHNLHDIT